MTRSAYIALSAVIIALTALAATIWQGWIARSHNILSVKPLINIHRSRLDGCSFFLESHGLGPAIIKEFSIIVRKKIFTNPKQDPYPEIFKIIGLSNASYEFHFPTIGEAYSPSSRLSLLEIKFNTEEEATNSISLIEKELIFKIVYSSIYENKNFIYFGNC